MYVSMIEGVDYQGWNVIFYDICGIAVRLTRRSGEHMPISITHAAIMVVDSLGFDHCADQREEMMQVLVVNFNSLK